MPQTQIYQAESHRDFEGARALCREWVEWQLKTYPEEREKIARKFQTSDYDRTVAGLEAIHAAPGGAVILCKLDRRIVGCVMYDRLDQKVAEIHRLFVSESGRGHGIGRALLEEMFRLMRTDGYTKAKFSSARFLKHARALYENMGFVEVQSTENTPPYVYFMERYL